MIRISRVILLSLFLANLPAQSIELPHNYRDEKGNATHYCNPPKATGPSPRPQTTTLFGLSKIDNFLRHPQRIYIVNDKGDARALWELGYHALALDGINNWHDNFIIPLKKFKEIVALIKPDYEGKKILHCLKKLIPLREQIKIVDEGQFDSIDRLKKSLWKKALSKDQNKRRLGQALNNYVKNSYSLSATRQPAIRLSTPTDPKTGEKNMVFVYGKYEPWLLEDDEHTKKVVEDVEAGNKIDEKKPKIAVLPSATLRDYAVKKLIPISYLEQRGFFNGLYHHKDLGPTHGVKMHSLDAHSHDLYYRFRISMDSSQPSTRRFPKILFKKAGQIFSKNPWDHITTFYGLEALNQYAKDGYAFLVEGESDTITMRFNKINALGVPGTANWEPSWNKYLESIPRLYITIEGDEGGDHFLETIYGNDFKDRVTLIDFTSDKSGPYAELKDPSDLHVGVYTDIAKQFIPHERLKEIAALPNGKIMLHKEILDTLMSKPNSAFIEKAREVYGQLIEKIKKDGISWSDFEPGLKKFLKEHQNYYKKKQAQFDKLNNDLNQRRQDNYELYKKAANESDLAEKKGMLLEWAQINQEQNQEHKAIIKAHMPKPFLDYYNLLRGRTSKAKLFGTEKGIK